MLNNNFGLPDPEPQPQPQSPLAPPPAPPQIDTAAVPSNGGCLGELSWIAASFVLPLASSSFYRRAARRSTGSAVLFFMSFWAIITLVTTLGLTLKLGQASSEIRRAFDTGAIPQITIHNGIATVQGKQPVILVDNNDVFVAIDTTGKFTSIDRSKYRTGFLLTRTDLVVLSTSNYQALPLGDLQEAFQQDPLVINGETMSQFWRGFTGIMAIFILIGLGFWNLAVRFIYLVVVAVVVWGVANLFRSKTPYGVVLSLGMYVFVPVIYVVNIFDRLGSSFFLLQTLILVVAWLVALNLALSKDSFGHLGEGLPLRAWRALLGLPLLVVMALDAVFSWKNGGWFILLALVLTLILLVAAGLYTRPRKEASTGFPTGGIGTAP
jgi:hypothetical protein